MRIVPFHAGLLPDLTRLINAHIRLVPPGWDVTEMQVADVVANSESLADLHFADDEWRVEPQDTLCVVDGDTLRAAANWDIYHSPLGENYATLNWIFSDANHPEALTLLLNELLEHARQVTVRTSTGRFAFGVGWMGIPLVWPHLIGGFSAAGFEVTQKWFIMTGDTGVSTHRPLPEVESFSVDWRINEAALEWELVAHSGENQIGECESWGIPPHFRDCPNYEQWTTIEWLGVEEPYQQRGVGAYLMQEQLRFQAARGIQHVMVWTNTDNIRIQNLNKAFGFTYGPECHVFEKSLG